MTMKKPKLKALFVLTLTMLYFPTFINCQSIFISEVKIITCIAFTKPTSADQLYKKRNNESLCVFNGNRTSPSPAAWNRPFSCKISTSNVSVCFSNTLVTDAGVFHLIVGNVKETTTILEVEYPPMVSLPSIQKTEEGQNLSITCSYSPGKPSATRFRWTNAKSKLRYNSQILRIPNIERQDSGTYACFAENTYSSGNKGVASATIQIDVQYGPTFTHDQTLRVSEGQYARVSTSINSNPASNVSWFRDNVLVSTQQSVNGTTSYTISRTQCTDTGSFLVVASNGIQSKQSTKVFLYVNCSPRLSTCGSSVKIYVDSDLNLYGQISVLSYPQPNASLALPSGAPNTIISLRIDAKETNLFTITLSRSNLQSDYFGTYVLNVANQYGRKTIFVNVTSSESSPSTLLVVGSVLGALLLLAVCALVFLSYKYFSVRKVSIRSYDSIDKKKAVMDNHPYEQYTCDKNAVVDEKQNISISKTFKLSILTISKKGGMHKAKDSSLKKPDCCKTNDSPFTETTKTTKRKDLYENAENFAAKAGDQDRGKTNGKRAADKKSAGKMNETTSKPSILPKPKKSPPKASKAFSYF